MSESINHPELTVEFWENRYQEDTARWDLGQPAPPFVRLLESSAAPAPGRMLVLGSGRGHDALLFAERGFEVVGVDFAPSAIAHARTAAQARHLPVEFLQRDIFSLEQDFANAFDYVLEHTCFCAIAPYQRSDYVRLVHTVLRPQGEFIALFWCHDRPGGPPYGSTPEEIRQLFAESFDRLSLENVTHSTPERSPDEYLGRFQARDIVSQNCL